VICWARLTSPRLVNLRPWFLGGYFMSAEQAVLNVLLTVPFGFGLPFVAKIGGLAVLVAGVLFSVGIELSQLVVDALYLALPTWSIDVNDVILNSAGVVIGYAAFLLTGAAYRVAVVGHLGDLRRGSWAHFHETLIGGTNQHAAG
jgi:hypothetical protein